MVFKHYHFFFFLTVRSFIMLYLEFLLALIYSVFYVSFIFYYASVLHLVGCEVEPLSTLLYAIG